MKKTILLVALMMIFAATWAYKKHVTHSTVKPPRSERIILGAYYFNGWTHLLPGQITQRLTDSFPERKSVWGWETGTPEIMQSQIDAAADGGISFFSFDWYSPDPGDKYTWQTQPLNNALEYYLAAPNRGRLKFNLMVCNHAKFTIGPDVWTEVCTQWIKLFKNPLYIHADGKPLISFYSAATLVNRFGTIAAVHSALDNFRQQCLAAGLPGVTIACCVGPQPQSIDVARKCGFDLLTEYNYHSAGFKNMDPAVYPIDDLVSGEYRAWNKIMQFSDMSFLPAITLNWDPRPKGDKPPYSLSPRYEGYSSRSVAKSVQSAVQWMDEHPNRTTKERIAILYAWNEITEGGYLTPSAGATSNPIDGIHMALGN